MQHYIVGIARLRELLRQLSPRWRRAQAKQRLEQVCRRHRVSKTQAVAIASEFLSD